MSKGQGSVPLGDVHGSGGGGYVPTRGDGQAPIDLMVGGVQVLCVHPTIVASRMPHHLVLLHLLTMGVRCDQVTVGGAHGRIATHHGRWAGFALPLGFHEVGYTRSQSTVVGVIVFLVVLVLLVASPAASGDGEWLQAVLLLLLCVVIVGFWYVMWIRVVHISGRKLGRLIAPSMLLGEKLLPCGGNHGASPTRRP